MNERIRQRQCVAPFTARQFVEPVAWWPDDRPDMSDERQEGNHQAFRAQELRAVDRHTARDHYDNAIGVLTVAGTDMEQARCLFDRASLCHRLRTPPMVMTALRDYAHALGILEVAGDPLEVADCLFNYAACCEDWAGVTERGGDGRRQAYLQARALDCYDQAAAHYRRVGAAPEDVAWCLMSRGNLVNKMSREENDNPTRRRTLLQLALDDIQEAERLLDGSPGTAPVLAQCLLHLSNVQSEIGGSLSTAARDVRNRARRIYERFGDDALDRLHAVHQPLGTWHEDAGEYAEARERALEAIAVAKRLADLAPSPELRLQRLAQTATSHQLAVRACLAMSPPDVAGAFDHAQLANFYERSGTR